VRVLFVNRFYWPETPATGQLLSDLAEGLAAAGHEVVVITAAHRPGVAADELRAGVSIRRVIRQPRSRAAKLAAFTLFHAAAVLALLRLARRGDVVVVMTDPPLIGVTAGAAALLRGARLVHWVQDIYPEIAATLTRHRWVSVLSGLRNVLWRRAKACVPLGTDMAAVLTEAGVPAERILVSPNWAPAGVRALPRGEPAKLRKTWGLQGKFVIAYSGNLGRVHDLPPVLDLAQELRDAPNFTVLFIGSGAGEADLRRNAEERRLTNVRFLPPQPREQLSESLAVADLHLVTLLPGCGRLVFPSKLYGITAAGRPLLFIGPETCEVAGVVRENGLGLTAERGAMSAAARAIRELASETRLWEGYAAAAHAFAARHTAVAAVSRWSEILRCLDGRHDAPTARLPGTPGLQPSP
jgi:glycosyltransferase involved in cell wall biosynthesis